MHSHPSAIAWLTAGAAIACTGDLPDESLIVSTRILGISVAVTTSLTPDEDAEFETSRAEALPLETVTLEPIFVDPTGPIDPASLDPIWIACPLLPAQGLLGCISAAFPLSLDDLEACPEPDLEALQSGDPLPPFLPCLLAGDPAAPTLTVPFANEILVGGDLEITLIGHTPDKGSTEGCASPFLAGKHKLPDECIYAVQRISTGPIEKLFELAQEFGIDLGDVPPPTDIPEADRNLRIARVSIERKGEPDTSADVPLGGIVAVALGDRLRVDLRSPEEDLQIFHIPVNEGQSFEEQTEAYEGRWFRTWGRMLSPSSDDPDSYNEWQLTPGPQDELDEPENGLAHLFYVVRDGRQGSAWFWFSVDVSP